MSRDWAREPPEGFDWDPEKYLDAARTHGVKFEIAALIFNDPYRLEYYDDREEYDEDRFYVLGLAGGMMLRVAFTLRGDYDQITRIITGFRASAAERRQYERNRKRQF